MDGTFVVIDRDQLLTFKEHLNAVLLDIQFTMEEEENNQLAFLDVLVCGKDCAKRKGDDDEEQGSNLAKSKRLEGKKCTDLIILNLPWRIDEPALKNYFSKFGEVAMVQVKRDPNTNQSRGYGFIRFRDYAAQAMCLAERHFIDSRWCDVRIPVSKVLTDPPCACELLSQTLACLLALHDSGVPPLPDPPGFLVPV
nr:unnamed protein product [Spirometra erinaceieuropaei]